jgi:hypothetical protein
MKRARFTSAILGAIAVPVLGLSLMGASSHPAQPRQPQAGQTVIVNCAGQQQVEPRSIVLACADQNSLVSDITWTSWTSDLASGSGTLEQNDCIPDCAAGHFHSYPVLLALWGNQSYGNGQRYTEITEILPGPRPPVFNGHAWVPAQPVETSQLWAPKI